MELYVGGTPLPKLGSMKDRVLREFLTKRAIKEVNKHKVVALSGIAMANMSKTPDATVRELVGAYSTFVSMELFLDNVIEDAEQMMSDEYQFWKKVRPKINISKDGKSATLSVSSLKPKS